MTAFYLLSFSQVWSSTLGQPVARQTFLLKASAVSVYVTAPAMSDQVMAVGDHEGNVALCNGRTMCSELLAAHSARVTCVVGKVPARDDRIITASEDHTVKV